VNPLTKTDIQFSGKGVTDQKLRRLVQDLQTAQATINTLIQTIATLSSANEEQAMLLATVSGLGPDFYVKGLTAGQVLKAISATNAAFQRLNLTDLGDVSETNPVDGQVLTRFHNEWINAPAPTGGSTSAENIGTGSPVYAGILGGELAFKSIAGDGVTTEVTATADTITVSAVQTDNEVAETDAMAYFNGY